MRFRCCAIVTADPALFGMARMLEVMAERYFDATRAFRTVDEGTRWLDALSA